MHNTSVQSPQLLDDSTSQVTENQSKESSIPPKNDNSEQEHKELRVYQRIKKSDKEYEDHKHSRRAMNQNQIDIFDIYLQV